MKKTFKISLVLITVATIGFVVGAGFENKSRQNSKEAVIAQVLKAPLEKVCLFLYQVCK